MIKITLYTTNTCATCAHIKKWLTNKGYKYTVINLDDEPEKQAEAIKISGAMTVPITVVERQEAPGTPRFQNVVIGLNLSKLAGALA